MMAAGADADEAGGSATPTRTLRRRSQRRSSSTPPANVSTSKAKNAHGLFFCYENGLRVRMYTTHRCFWSLGLHLRLVASKKRRPPGDGGDMRVDR